MAIPESVGGDKNSRQDAVGNRVAQMGAALVKEARAAGEKEDGTDDHDAAGDREERGAFAEEGDGGEGGEERAGAAGERVDE